MGDNFSNITKRGVDQNKTVAEAVGEITNVGEEKYAMADKRKVVKTAAGHETISFTDTDTKIVNGTAEVSANSDGSVSLSPTSGSDIKTTDNVFIRPETNDGSSFIIVQNGLNPASDCESLQVGQDLVRARSTDGSTGNAYLDLNNTSGQYESKIYVDVSGGGATVLANNNSASMISGTASTTAEYNGLTKNTNSVSQYDADVSNTATVNKEILENKLTTGPLRQKVKGWLDPYLITATFDNATRSITYTSSSGTCEFYSDGNFFSVPNGDPKLTGQVPDLNQWVWTYHDENGDIQSESSVSLNSIRRYNLGSFMRFQKGGTPTTGLSIATINRFESSQANEVENEASYRTKSIINEVPVLFEGTLGGNSVGHTGGIYYSPRDKRFQFDPIAGASKTWVKYYQEGIDDAGENFVKASVTAGGVPYITDTEIGIGATGRLVYNNFNPGLGVSGEWEVLTVPLNDYVGCHFIVADGATRNVLAIIGQTSYNSLADARSGLSSERSGLVIDSDVFRDVGVVGSCIFKSDGSLEYADVDTLSLFDYPAGFVATGISGGTSLNLQNAYDNSTQPQTTTDAVKGSLQVKDGVGAGAPIFEVLNSSDSPVMSVSENGIDAGGQDINNANRIESITSSESEVGVLMSTTSTSAAGINYLRWYNSFYDRATAEMGAYVGGGLATPNFILKVDDGTGTLQSRLIINENGVSSLPGAENTNIDDAGNKAVPTVEWSKENLLIINGTQAANDWGTSYNTSNIGDLTSIADLNSGPEQTHITRNLIRNNSFSTAHRLTGGSSEITLGGGTSSDGYVIITGYEVGTGSSVNANTELILNQDGTATLTWCNAADITSSNDITTKEYCDDNYVQGGSNAQTTDQNTSLTVNDRLFVFTGTTIQTATLPLANSRGSGICQEVVFKSLKSSGSASIARSGSDVIYELNQTSSVTSSSIADGQHKTFMSNGVDSWFVITY